MSYGQQAAAQKGRETEADLLKQTLGHLHQADEVSDRTCVQLNQQTEQIRRIQADAEQIDHNLDQSAWLLKGLKPFGWVKGLFGGQPSPPPAPAAVRGYPAAGAAPSGGAAAPLTGADRIKADAARRATAQAGPGAQFGGQMIAASTSAAGARKSAPAQASETDQLYDQIEDVLGNLKQKSLDINHTLGHHNEMLDKLEPSIDGCGSRVDEQRRAIVKLGAKPG